MKENTSDPRRDGNATRARSRVADNRNDTATQRPGRLAVTIDDLASVLGQSYVDGLFGCIFCRRRTSLMTCYIADDHTARCGRCGREITLSRLRRAVTEDPVLARRLRHMMEVTV